MVLRQQQHVILFAQLHQPATDQRSLRKIKRRPRLLFAQPRQLNRSILPAAQVVLDQRQLCRHRQKTYLGLPVHLHEHAAQPLVSSKDFIQGTT